MIESEIQIYGVREALAELGRIDSKTRFKAVNKLKAAGESLLAAPRANYPMAAPMSRWAQTGRLGYNPSKVQSGVQIQVGGRTPRDANAYAIVTLVQKNAGGALFDIGGLRGGAQGDTSGNKKKRQEKFLSNLNHGYGPAQRGLWRSVREVRANANAALMQALEDVAAEVNRKLVA